MKPDRYRANVAPNYSSPIGKSGVAAVKLVADGAADAGAQKIAMSFIIDVLAGLYDDPFCSDDAGGERETSYAQGRMFVGRELRKIIVRPYEKLTAK